ncbi:MAG: M56 family metallopeptidase [Verrucomicrobiota bacterium]
MEPSHEFFSALIRASLFLAAGGIVAYVLLRAFRVQSPRIHRFVWILVLAQGLLFFRVPMEFAVLEPTPISASLNSSVGAGLLELAAPTSAAAESSAPVAKTQPKSNPADWLLLIWLIGIAATACVYFLSYACMINGLLFAKRAPEPWQAEWTQLLKKAGRRPIRLLVHNRLGPFLCLTPLGYRVVVPRETWEEFSKAQRLAVLEHELAHVQRRDVWNRCSSVS